MPSHTQKGSETVQRTGTIIREIIDNVSWITGVIGEKCAGAHEQTAGINQVNTAITEMDTVTQQNSAMVQQTSSSAEAMREQAASLSELINTFVLGDDNAQPAVASNATPLPVARPKSAAFDLAIPDADEGLWQTF